ncbi:MAG: PIN domain-containing protein [Bifidobacteriaceae bacterium]|jgi:predicted nucleic acid-binding protein|nr:PIN domain-containing protein [Bifidobacteriaceae bacterium]
MGLTSSGRAAVDASAAIAWQNVDEPFHGAAVELIAGWPELVMHTVNLAEMLAGMDKSEWEGLIEVMREDGFTFHHTTAEQLAEAKRATRLKMRDACVIAVAKAQGAQAVLSLDSRLIRAARAEGFATGR